MKDIIIKLFAIIMIGSLTSCNDDGTGGELAPKDGRYLIGSINTLPPRYAAVGIGAWILVSAVGIGGHKYCNRRKKKDADGR